jgi:hypothetical protein
MGNDNPVITLIDQFDKVLDLLASPITATATNTLSTVCATSPCFHCAEELVFST